MSNIIISCITIITFIHCPLFYVIASRYDSRLISLSLCLFCCLSVCLCCSGVGSAAALSQNYWSKGVPGRDVTRRSGAGVPWPSFYVSTLSLSPAPSMSLCSALLAVDFARVRSGCSWRWSWNWSWNWNWQRDLEVELGAESRTASQFVGAVS